MGKGVPLLEPQSPDLAQRCNTYLLGLLPGSNELMDTQGLVPSKSSADAAAVTKLQSQLIHETIIICSHLTLISVFPPSTAPVVSSL